MKRKIASILFSGMIFLGIGLSAATAAIPEPVVAIEETTAPSTADIIWDAIELVEHKDGLTIKECQQEIDSLNEYMARLLAATQEYQECAEYNIVLDEIKLIEECKAQYTQDIEELLEKGLWEGRKAEYPVATEAWLYMKNVLGYSDIVCAGIMGNLMAETGGSTLALDWDSNGGCGYGLIQWIGNRRVNIKNIYGDYPTTHEQMRYMHNELYGLDGVRQQVSDAELRAIMGAETPEDCAYAFACYFERCAVQYRSFRRGLARQAYEYFVG